MTGLGTRVLQFAEWMIGTERDEHGHAVSAVHEVQCTACEEMSDPSIEQGLTDRWALRHAELTGHYGFRETITGPLVVSPAPTNPLFEQEAER
jgi:hypothetical protein